MNYSNVEKLSEYEKKVKNNINLNKDLFKNFFQPISNDISFITPKKKKSKYGTEHLKATASPHANKFQRKKHIIEHIEEKTKPKIATRRSTRKKNQVQHFNSEDHTREKVRARQKLQANKADGIKIILSSTEEHLYDKLQAQNYKYILTQKLSFDEMKETKKRNLDKAKKYYQMNFFSKGQILNIEWEMEFPFPKFYYEKPIIKEECSEEDKRLQKGNLPIQPNSFLNGRKEPETIDLCFTDSETEEEVLIKDKTDLERLSLVHSTDLEFSLVELDNKENDFYYQTSFYKEISSLKVVSPHKIKGNCYWKVPPRTSVGKYCLQFSSLRLDMVSRSEEFMISEAFGEEDCSNVGAWCICGETKYKSESKKNTWIQCDGCQTWHHIICYQSDLKTFETNVLLFRKKYSKYESEIIPILEKESREFNIQTFEKEFLCWYCKETNNLDIQKLKLFRLFSMISKSSGGYQRKNQGKDDVGKQIKSVYNTPDQVVCYLREVLRKRSESFLPENKKDLKDGKKCIDLGAGHGKLCSILGNSAKAIEIDPDRCDTGKKEVASIDWICSDALSWDFLEGFKREFICCVSNPDFEVGMEFIVLGLYLIEQHNPDARCYFLLPSDFFEASALRTRIFKILDFSIEEEHKLGHLNYLKDSPMSQKRQCDSLFVLTKGRKNKGRHVTINARLNGML
eukprot:snap_masked-scaffold_21-processed-gene-2.12-mRNA-1 protein AED:1.00 eAED:1.00 QI:0/-1/0/0/-1/1/1/0/682